jgi:hypothetical protein
VKTQQTEQKREMKSVQLCIFLLLVSTLLAIACCQTPSCSLKTKSGTIDLSSLRSDTYYEAKDTYGTYYVNICANAAKACNGIDYPSVFFYSYDLNYCSFFAGTLSKMVISLQNENDPNGGVKVEYTGGKIMFGSEQKTRILINCDKTAKQPSALKFVKEVEESPYNVYEFQLSSASACPGASPGSSSGRRIVGVGGALLIILPFLFFIYLIVGSLVLKFYYKKEGTEAIMHYEFLKQIPFYILDGVLFIKDGIMALVQKIRGRSDYQSVDA